MRSFVQVVRYFSTSDPFVLTLLLSPVPPTFLVEVVSDTSPTDFDLFPPIRNVPLVETSPGVVCINCSAVGYPNLQYTWTYSDYGGDWKNVSSDPCMKFQDDQSEVCKEIRHLMNLLCYQATNSARTVCLNRYRAPLQTGFNPVYPLSAYMVL